MDDVEIDQPIDDDFVAQPATRLDLWKALALIRRKGLAQQLQVLALDLRLAEKANQAAEDIEQLDASIDELMDELLGISRDGSK